MRTREQCIAQRRRRIEDRAAVVPGLDQSGAMEHREMRGYRRGGEAAAVLAGSCTDASNRARAALVPRLLASGPRYVLGRAMMWMVSQGAQ